MPNPYGWGDDEPQIKPKDQGGDTVATFSQKIYNLFDKLFDTLNSYPWSVATPSDAGYMSAADKTALNALSPVESGTWTPVLEGTTVTGVLTYAEQYGWYKKINNLVYVVGKIEVSGYTTLPTGTVVIRGLPYSAANVSARYFGVANGMNGLNDSFNIITGVTFLGNTSSINLFVNSRTTIGKTRYYAEFTSNPANNEFGIALAQSSQRIYFNCLYRTA